MTDRSEPAPDIDVVHDDEAHRFVLRSAGEHVGLIDYRHSHQNGSDTYDLHHTEVQPAGRGQGLAGVLVRGALDDIANRDGRVVPTCSYVRSFIDDHPEYQPLLADA